MYATDLYEYKFNSTPYHYNQLHDFEQSTFFQNVVCLHQQHGITCIQQSITFLKFRDLRLIIMSLQGISRNEVSLRMSESKT